MYTLKCRPGAECWRCYKYVSGSYIEGLYITQVSAAGFEIRIGSQNMRESKRSIVEEGGPREALFNKRNNNLFNHDTVLLRLNLAYFMYLFMQVHEGIT